MRNVKTLKGLQRAVPKKGPVMVVFSGSNCPACLFLDGILKKLEGEIPIVKIDVEKAPDLADRYGIMAIPTIFLAKDRVVKKVIDGAIPEPELRKEIEAIKRG